MRQTRRVSTATRASLNVAARTRVQREVHLSPEQPDASPFPNPFTGVLRVPLPTRRTNNLRITVVDVKGQTVAIPFEGAVGAATAGTTARWTPNEELPSGIYIIRLTSDDLQDSYRVHYRK